MLIFSHLFAGLILGLVLLHFTGKKDALLFCAFGAVLPDLIDKPLGHLILAGSGVGGRLIVHGAPLLLALLIAGYLLWERRRSIALLALAAGLLSHQVLDRMWEAPEVWWYPFLGPIPPSAYPGYFLTMFQAEAGSISEWVFAFAGIGTVYALLHGGSMTAGMYRGHLISAIKWSLLALSAYSILSLLNAAFPSPVAEGSVSDAVAVGVISLAGFITIFLLEKRDDRFSPHHRDPD